MLYLQQPEITIAQDAGGDMLSNTVTRYVLSRIDKDGMRIMVYAVQGRNTHATRNEAEIQLKFLLENNSKERLTEVFGERAIGTFEVSAIECYPGHFDPIGCYIREDLNPGQVIIADPKLRELLKALK
jgi:hypothetical protein